MSWLLSVVLQWTLGYVYPFKPCLTEWTKSDREKEISYDILNLQNLKINDIRKRIYQTDKTHRLREGNYGFQGEGWGNGIVKEFRMDRYTLLFLKWITNKDLLSSIGNSAQYYVAAWMGGEFRGEWIHVYVWLGALLSTWNYHNIVNWLYPNTK